MDKLKYTICFIKRGEEILLLNREKPSWMGCWNGIGGKFEKNETPRQCILREVYEETNIKLQDIKFKGIVTWDDDNNKICGMYLFMQEVPEDYKYDVPIKTREGILDWKKISWIMDSQNTGVASNIHKYFPKMLGDEGTFEYYCKFKDKLLLDVDIKELRVNNNVAGH